MELKHVIDGQAIQGIFCSNCTFMELKLQDNLSSTHKEFEF